MALGMCFPHLQETTAKFEVEWCELCSRPDETPGSWIYACLAWLLSQQMDNGCLSLSSNYAFQIKEKSRKGKEKQEKKEWLTSVDLGGCGIMERSQSGIFAYSPLCGFLRQEN